MAPTRDGGGDCSAPTFGVSSLTGDPCGMSQERDLGAELELAERTLKENQDILMVSERMASLGRLAAGIAHEMNTPLAAVRAALAELLKLVHEYEESAGDKDVTPQDHREIAKEMLDAVNLAEKASERVAAFVRSIKLQTRDLSTKESRRFNLVAVIRETVLLLSHSLRAANCSVVFEPPSEVIEMWGPPGRLIQVVTNLVTNAIDASSAKGGGAILIRLGLSSGGIELRVQDHGIGIARENMSRIFEPMFTSKPVGQGTGLGLTIVRDIMTSDFNATIDVESEEGQGTTFVLRFAEGRENAMSSTVS
jgi:signal transduction histidine kinase